VTTHVNLLAPPADLAREFAAFCDGIEEAGWHEYARRGRVIAEALADALEQLDGERRARVAMQEARDRVLELLAKRCTPPEPEQ